MKKFTKIFIPTFCLSLIIFVGTCINKRIFVNGAEGTIKYIDFTPSINVLKDTMNEDINSNNSDEFKTKVNWIHALSFLATKYGGNFKNYKKQHLKEYVDKIKKGENIEIKNEKLFNYYMKAYSSILSGFLGVKEVKAKDGTITQKYGLKVSHPIPRGYPFTHYDDFGAKRTFGFRRPHLGHDLFCSIGTPVLAIEDGIVEIMGWNRYGGWRIGIRSHDKLRYWYYAHLRKDKPFHPSISEGAEVKAGQHIGYVGKTGYSSKENVNNLKRSHLHVGLQIIFNEEEKDSPNQIWISLYDLFKLIY